MRYNGLIDKYKEYLPVSDKTPLSPFVKGIPL